MLGRPLGTSLLEMLLVCKIPVIMACGGNQSTLFMRVFGRQYSIKCAGGGCNPGEWYMANLAAMMDQTASTQNKYISRPQGVMVDLCLHSSDETK